jgi:hypothetical protein
VWRWQESKHESGTETKLFNLIIAILVWVEGAGGESVVGVGGVGGGVEHDKQSVGFRHGRGMQ